MNELAENFGRLKRLNWVMVVAIGILLIIGVCFIYSARFVIEERSLGVHRYVKQIGWIGLGITVYAALAMFDYRRLGRFSWWLYGIALVLLVAVLIPGVGIKMYGAQRWLWFFGFMLQPSELAKFAAVFVLASMLERSGEHFGSWKSVAVVLGVVAVPVALIIKEPDLGTSLVFLPTAFVMMFVAGVPLRILGTLAGAGVLMVGIVLGALFLPDKLGFSEAKKEKIEKMVRLSSYQKDRIMVYFRSDVDPLGAGWNKMQSEIAVGSGGMTGKGFLKGTQNMLGFLPRSVTPTDFIFSVIAEETGFVGSAVLLFLYGTIMLCGLHTALHARDKYGRLLCAGFVAMLFCHVFINMAMTIGIMPITGIPLPLLSYGGSFMVIVMSALGVIQSVYVHSK
ncbi:MAG: rod shape-determining protein RodA [Verrucomicrobia bacterium]|nr:rod shape-determining protein RodA [Verrucomicrobiota bacterium]